MPEALPTRRELGARRRRRRRIRTGSALLLVLALPGVWLVAADPRLAAGPEAGARSHNAGPGLAQAAPASLERTEPTARAPLIAVVHATRPPLDIRGEGLLDLARGRIDDWGAFGEQPAPLRIVAGPSALGGMGWLWALGSTPPPGTLRRTDRDAVALVEEDPNVVAIVSAEAAGPGVRAMSVDGIDPIRDPGRYPLQIPASEAPGPVTTLLGVGDIIPSRTVHFKMVAAGDWTSPFRYTWDRLSAADLTFAPFDATMTRRAQPARGGTTLLVVPEVLAGLELAGFDLLSVAANHSADLGPESAVENVELLQSAGIRTVGAGRNLTGALAPAILERNGVRFAFLAFNSIIGPPVARPDRPGVATIRMAPWHPFSQGDLDTFTREVRRLRAEADVVIVIPHWGVEYTNVPNTDQRRVARALVAAGADLVIGSHPHWVQGAEVIDGAFVAYSLGNFVFDQTWSQETLEGVGVELVFWGRKLKAVEFIPSIIEDWHQPRFVSREQGLHILERIWAGSGEPFRAGASRAAG